MSKHPHANRHDSAAAVAGLSILACAAILAVALAQHALLVYGPAIRGWLLDTLTPEFGMGVVFTLACIGVVAVAMYLDYCRRESRWMQRK